MKTLSKAALSLPLLTVALLSGCGTTTATVPQVPSSGASASLSAQAVVMDMKTAEASGRIGAWASGRIGAWASGQELNASTLPSGARNTFSENLNDWQSIHLSEAQKLAPNLGTGVVVAVIEHGSGPLAPGLSGPPHRAEHLARLRRRRR